MEQKLTTKEEYLKRINVIVEYINNHLDENIDLGMLAEMSGFSPWHFHRIVRAFLGEPVGAFILSLIHILYLHPVRGYQPEIDSFIQHPFDTDFLDIFL